MMATKNPNLPAPEEQFDQTVEDVQSAATPTSPEEATPTTPATEQSVDFSEEEAALAAHSEELDLGEESPEEQETTPREEGDPLAGKSREELIAWFDEALRERPVQTLRRDAEALKIAFYKQHRSDVEAEKRAFIEAGGSEEEFTPTVDGYESRLKELFGEYRRLRDHFLETLEAEKLENLKIKQQIIEELKELTAGDETLNHTFARFRELQNRWKETGIVPQQQMKDVWENYNLQVENFYNFIKINKELRDLDLKRNLEQKTSLCEQAEALIEEPSVVDAFHKLQKLHDQWRETGPVAMEFKESLWERFKEASSRINRAHQEHFEHLKQEQLRNLELKTSLCEQTEELASQPHTSRKEWTRANERLLELQKVWKTIGFAPKKENTHIYERFRTACDNFFEQKRAFYATVKEEMEHNLQLKQELCEAAEALQHSEEWKQASDELIALQARWKEVGAVSRRHSDAIWKRFRKACDNFFERKAQHFASQDNAYEQNLEQKLNLLQEMESANPAEGGYEMIRDFQRRWTEIGFVPIKRKEEIQKRYKQAIDRLFTALRSGEHTRSMNRFREKVSTLKAGGNQRRIESERDRLYNKVRQLEQEIQLLENNIGFFSNSKGAESLVEGVREKIRQTKEEMARTIEKVRLIDEQNQ